MVLHIQGHVLLHAFVLKDIQDLIENSSRIPEAVFYLQSINTPLFDSDQVPVMQI